MGIDADVAKFLFFSRSQNVNFARTLMLGNQRMELSADKLSRIASRFGFPGFESVKNNEEFFKLLGAESVSAMDVSDYENAAVIHDLNTPIATNLEEKYSFVIDGGTLEHVFNFPVGIENAMKMVSIGGHLAIITGGNNFLGHGFYQFSPELFYRIFSPENGFAVQAMIAAEVGGRWFEVADPRAINSRVELINKVPVYMLVLARRTEIKPIFKTTPYQSDYVDLWHTEEHQQKNIDSPLKQKLKNYPALWNILVEIKQRLKVKEIYRERSFENDRAFKRMDV